MTFAAFDASLRTLEQTLPDALADAHVSLLVVGYDAAIRRVPVDTGALRAEHIVTEGDHQRLRFEPPNRPGPDTIVTRGVDRFAPPSAGDVKAALASVGPFTLLTILNQRFYASFVHDGTSRQAPQPWLLLAADEIEAAGATAVEKGLQERIDAIG